MRKNYRKENVGYKHIVCLCRLLSTFVLGQVLGTVNTAASVCPSYSILVCMNVYISVNIRTDYSNFSDNTCKHCNNEIIYLEFSHAPSRLCKSIFNQIESNILKLECSLLISSVILTIQMIIKHLLSNS